MKVIRILVVTGDIYSRSLRRQKDLAEIAAEIVIHSFARVRIGCSSSTIAPNILKLQVYLLMNVVLQCVHWYAAM